MKKKKHPKFARHVMNTIDAKNIVAETVVAPFPLVATWKGRLWSALNSWFYV